MPLAFNKQEVVLFDETFEAFEDQLVASKMFSTFQHNHKETERANNTYFRPMPYIVPSYNGLDQTANFDRNFAQLSVPISLSTSIAVPMLFSPTDLRDPTQREKLSRAAVTRLSSDLNRACSDLCALSGSIVVKRSGIATGFDDVAQADNAFNRLGVDMADRKFLLSSSDYNSMASNLAARVVDNSKSLDAYEKAYIGRVAGFETYKADYAYRLTAAAGVGVTITSANQRYVPRATQAGLDGRLQNVDNRFQTIGITVTSGTVKVGDCFTIAGVNEVHHITKQDTGSLKTFRIQAIVTGAGGTGTVAISPPIISADSTPTDPEVQYKNCTAAPAAGAAVTFLNTASTLVNPFWQGDVFEIMPGEYQPDPDAGMPVMRGTTKQGIVITMAKQATINNLGTRMRWDLWFGLLNKQPQMSGIELFSQP